MSKYQIDENLMSRLIYVESMSVLLWDTVPDLVTYYINEQYRFRRVLIRKSPRCSCTKSMVWMKMKVLAKFGTSSFA